MAMKRHHWTFAGNRPTARSKTCDTCGIEARRFGTTNLLWSYYRKDGSYLSSGKTPECEGSK